MMRMRPARPGAESGPERTAAEQEVAAVYSRSYARLVGVLALAASSRADAEDCVQEAFVRLLGRWDSVRRYDDPEAWLRTVAFRLLANRRRTAASRLGVLLRQRRPDAAPGPDAGRLDIERALAALSLPQRQVVVLHYLLGLGVTEVAGVLRIPAGTVKSRLNRARGVLAELLDEEDHDE